LARLERAREVLAGVVRRHDLQVKGRIPEIGTVVVHLEDESLRELRAELEGDPRVVSITAERRVELRLVPDDFAFDVRDANAPSGDWMQWNLRRYRAIRAWSLSRGLRAEVAVIDTGADGTHPDLAPRIVAAAAFDTVAPTVDPSGHGTHTAGLACGQSNNDYGVASLGFRCNLFVEKFTEPAGCGSVAKAIVAAANRRSDAISMSFGGCDSALNNALRYAWRSGSIPVAAGANEPVPDPATNHPAQYVQPEGSGPDIDAGRGLVVTSAKHDGTRSTFAQRTTGVSIAAFGSATNELSGGQQGMLSTWPPPPVEGDWLLVRRGLEGDVRFAYLVGTSMATPQVAGLVALIRSIRPRMPAREVVRLIKLTASGGGRYVRIRGLGWGIINAHAALGAALHRDITAPVSRVRSARVRARRANGSARRPWVTVRLKRFDPRRPAMPTSGIRVVNVFVSVNGRRFHRLRKTKRRRIRFRGRPGRRYRFYTRAVDRAGNREAVPRGPDAFLNLG
jgi:subtilisin family serine protease